LLFLTIEQGDLVFGLIKFQTCSFQNDIYTRLTRLTESSLDADASALRGILWVIDVILVLEESGRSWSRPRDGNWNEGNEKGSIKLHGVNQQILIWAASAHSDRLLSE
jgi:hypothetical protein